MLQEKQNNGLKGFDELSEIPGETSIDKSMLWQKLETRLEPKKKSKAIWYWAAAACLLIVFSVPFLNKKDQPIVKDVVIAPIKQMPTPVIPEKINPEENNLITIHTAPVVNKKHEILLVKGERVISLPVIVKENKSLPEPIINQPENIAKTNDPVRPDSSSLVRSTPVKLRVVHINELDDEDKFATQKIKNTNPRDKKSAEAYTGVINFNIHLKN